MASRPDGTVTFLFTDIEGSTKLAQEHPETWERARNRHHAILRAAIEEHRGYVFQIIGDAFCAAFQNAGDALRAATLSQSHLHREPWGKVPIKVRMGLHTDQAELLDDGQYRGYLALSRVQRLMSAGHGGQILFSLATQKLICDQLTEGVSLRDMGERRLKDFVEPEHIYQLVIAGLPADFPPLKTLAARLHNLPAQTTSFIGREQEMTEIKQAFRDHRIVTLTGPGGTGKTRLSLQVAGDLLHQFADGAWFVELAPLSNPDLVPQTILSVLEIGEQQGKTATHALIDSLQNKKLLLVLDNCEHLIEASARVADAILSGCPGVKILASSREALRVKGEMDWHVPSLTVPETKRLPDIEQLAQCEAVQLFIERSVLSQPRFALTKENAPAVAQICSHLDGIPLAIELAAARIKVLSAHQIAARLDDRFRLLTGGARTALPRHQTLRAMIDWSYDLLSEKEQLLLRRLAVFAGGWTLDLAEEVCSDEQIDPYEMLDLLSRLVDKSLVAVQESAIGARYRILETVRQYAQEKLFDSGEADMLQDRHVQAFLTLAEEAEPEVRGHNQVIWLNRLEEELDNLRAALGWSWEGDVESCLRLASALWRFWDVRAYAQEGLEWLTKVLEATRSLRTAARARALARAGQLVGNNGGTADQAELLAEEALTLGRELDDKPSMARALLSLSVQEMNRGREETGMAYLKQGLDVSIEIQDHGLIAVNLLNLAFSSIPTDPTAITSMEQAVKEARLSGDKRLIGHSLNQLSVYVLTQGNYEYARTLAWEGFSLFQEMDDKPNIASCYFQLADLALFTEDYALAEEYCLQAKEMCEALNRPHDVALSLWYLSLLHWVEGNPAAVRRATEEGLSLVTEDSHPLLMLQLLFSRGQAFRLERDFPSAKACYRAALDILQEADIRDGYCLCLEGVAALVIAEGENERGARLFGAWKKLREGVFFLDNYPFLVRQRQGHISAARAELGEAAFQSAWQTGYEMSFETAREWMIEDLR